MNSSHIAEVAVVDVEGGREYSTLINIFPHAVGPKSTLVHGITTDMVHDPSLPSLRSSLPPSASPF